MLSRLVHSDHDTHQREQPQHEKNFPGSYARSSRLRSTRSRSPLINLDSAPEDQNQRPPSDNDAAEYEYAIVMQQQQQADKDQNQSAEYATAARAKARHEQLTSLSRQWALRGARRCRRPCLGSARRRRGHRIDVAIHRCHRRRQQYRADHNQDERIRIREIKNIAANFVQQEQHADRDQHRRAHQPANRAPWTAAATSVRHACLFTFRPAGYGTSKLPAQSAAPASIAESCTTETSQSCAAATKFRFR